MSANQLSLDSALCIEGFAGDVYVECTAVFKQQHVFGSKIKFCSMNPQQLFGYRSHTESCTMKLAAHLLCRARGLDTHRDFFSNSVLIYSLLACDTAPRTRIFKDTRFSDLKRDLWARAIA
jgi:hypothetical protein